MGAKTRASVLIMAALLICATSSDAEAKRRRRRHHATHVEVVESNPSSFGLGIILGGPTGLTGKLYLSDFFAIDFALGYYTGIEDQAIGAHLDLLFHPVNLANADGFTLPLYLGVGLRVADDYCNGRRCDSNGIDLGLRVPVGIAFEFTGAPIDIFIELALIIDIVNNDGGQLHLDLAAGFRYWF
jgi:hypothetical protein